MPGWAPDGNRLAYAIFTGRGGIMTVRRVNGVWQKPIERLGWGSTGSRGPQLAVEPEKAAAGPVLDQRHRLGSETT